MSPKEALDMMRFLCLAVALIFSSGCQSAASQPIQDAPMEAADALECDASDPMSLPCDPCAPRSGTFQPKLDGNQAGITYSNQRGYFVRVDDFVMVMIDLEWQNTDTSQSAKNVGVVPPFHVFDTAMGSMYAGDLDFYSSNFGIQGSGFGLANLTLRQKKGSFINVLGRTAKMDSSLKALTLGDRQSLRVVGTITYRSTSEAQYPELL
jgi:hypothetical protein